MNKSIISFLLLFLVTIAVPSYAQNNNENIFKANKASIEKKINKIEKDLNKPEGIRISQYVDSIGALRSEINLEKTEISIKTQTLQGSLSVVNMAIKDVKTPPPEIQKQIDKINKDIATLQSEDIELNLLMVKVNDLEKKVNEIAKARILSNVQVKHEFPFSPSFIKKAVPDIIKAFYFIVSEPYKWMSSWVLEKTYDEIPNIIYLVGSIFLIIVMVIFVKRMFLKHLNYRSDIENPSYASKLTAAVIEAVSVGIIPAGVLGLVYFWVSEYAVGIDNILSSVMLGGIAVLIYIVLLHSFAKAIFSPNMINWRLTSLSRQQTKIVYRIIIILGAVFGFHIFFFNILMQIETNEASGALFTVIMNIIEAGLSISLLRHTLWEKQKKPDDTSSDENLKIQKKKLNLWMMARTLMSFVVLISGVASFLGYIGFGDFIIKRLLYSTLFISLLVVMRSFFHEATLLFINSEYATNRLGFNQKRLKVFRFWLMMFLDLTLFCIGVYIVLPLWGVPKTDIVNTGKMLATGFSIGGVTVSLVNILMAILVFLVIAKLFSWTQNWLKSKIFPATDMESSLQDSLSAGVGYIGMIMGFIISISVLGINFTNLAIVAGALSVGIGFGLQNIVNNFVSGIIILLERPIKVGDWIIINGNEGVVSRISFRATEIETFNKASILIPNAEIISNVLLNWTHNNNYGRVDIPVSVSYKSDIEQIKEILLGIASNSSKVMFVPQPQVIFQGIDEDSLKFELRFFVSDINDSVSIASDIRYSIVKKFREENIQIPYRHQIMHIKTQNKGEEFSFELSDNEKPDENSSYELNEKDKKI